MAKGNKYLIILRTYAYVASKHKKALLWRDVTDVVLRYYIFDSIRNVWKSYRGFPNEIDLKVKIPNLYMNLKKAVSAFSQWLEQILDLFDPMDIALLSPPNKNNTSSFKSVARKNYFNKVFQRVCVSFLSLGLTLFWFWLNFGDFRVFFLSRKICFVKTKHYLGTLELTYLMKKCVILQFW